MDAINSDDIQCLKTSAGGVNQYEESPIPDGRDDAVGALVTKALDADILEDLVALIEPRYDSAILGIYAARMASLCVRRSDPSLLRNGLIAVGLAHRKTLDARDDTTSQALLWRSAEILGLDPTEEFTWAAAKIPSSASFFTSWLKRRAKFKNVASVGYKESADKDGFRYVWGKDYAMPNPKEDSPFQSARNAIRRLAGRSR